MKNKYEGMTEKQINVLGRFMQYKSATTIQKKMVEIIGESYMINDWIYYGFIDTGKMGLEHCSMGHALRYVHYAKNIKTKEIVKFGIKCVSDFFNITPEKLKMIQKGFVEINYIVDEIINKFNSNYNFDEYKNKLQSINDKPEHFNEIMLLLDNGLPLPYCYEKEINLIYSREKSELDFNQFLDENPQYLSIVVMAKFLSSDNTFSIKHPILFEKMKSIIKHLEINKSLSEAQLRLLNKIILLDFDTIDNKIDSLNMLPSSCFNVRGRFDEYAVFKSIVLQYNEWGLSDKQLQLIDKIYDRNKNKIEEMNNIKYNE